ncbi:PTS system D-glucosamine-specific IIA component, Glc family /PTS system D-glucosamine-specific IIB component, Glc family /PTS system D-glucosamine-specific IIC component, Glc family [Clostridium grantii DSM 8605]|uniref:PTS system D-glucosamine-specific IIA component, Glc family /PTS system D-glucosamine-specific IIB component, Glc family /PTS system D-glucosamine-specific IIC component, Glc family n=2 Tax=Clostridium TaxID=1485 RepID=A0A1M5QLZ2_9CLOT|nr:PTS system D-glucosamine-specific IIA component, Glc family /PTS system D-glucosamine-specific IIB component, Glc family /PTS system D-glucosamine-specific IIC component, Glc family [Clostridium grantii DSM 8605]
MNNKKTFSILQKIGTSLMLPVSVLPAAGILLRLGQPDLLGKFGMEFEFLATAGNAIFSNLPMIFAVGVAIGFSGGEGVAALSAVIGQLILTGILEKQSINIGTNINMGVLGGISIGLLTAVLYKKFHKIELPKILGFFSGKRFIPIITAFVSFVFAILSIKIWVPIQIIINRFALKASVSIFGPAFYAAGKRLLIPAGLHHLYYPTFLFQFGEFVSNGEKYYGDLPRFFHGDPTAGVFMAAEYPILMFGLPAAALAMILASRKENRKKILGIMGSAALVSFFTGITEPIEFSFIFVAPFLFLFHVFAAFISGIITSYFDLRLGYTFSASFIDYLLGYNYANKPLFLLIIGPVFFVMYFLVFYFFIKYKDIQTPGRESERNFLEENKISLLKKSINTSKAEGIVEALGGIKNVENVDACVTRLRLTVKEPSLVDRDMIKNLGAAGIFEAASSFQIIFGIEAESLKDSISNILKAQVVTDIANKENHCIEVYKDNLSEKNIIDEDLQLTILNPIKGKIISLEKVNDGIFSEKIMGEGFAIVPMDNKVFSPVSGEVIILFPTKHAIVIKEDKGYEIMIHVGIDSVKLNGQGFETNVSKGDKVEEGDLLLTYDKDLIMEKGDIKTPIIITNLKENEKIYVKYGDKNKGDIAAIIIKE